MRKDKVNFGFGSLIVLVVCSMVIFSSLVLAADSDRGGTGSGSGDEAELDKVDCYNSDNCREIDLVWSILITSIGFDSLGSNDKFWIPYFEGEGNSKEITGTWATYLEKNPEPVEEEEDVVECVAEITCDDLTKISDSNNLEAASSENCGISGMVSALNTAAGKYMSLTEEKIYVSSSFRTIEKQAELYWDNCYDSGERISCSVPTHDLGISDMYLDSANTEKEVKNIFCEKGVIPDVGHTAGSAVDIVHEGANSKPSYVSNVAKMNQLQDIMQAEGFCRLSSEAWHFDYGSSCTPHTTNDYTYTRGSDNFNPAETCQQRGCSAESCWWDYANNEFDSCDEYEESELADKIVQSAIDEFILWENTNPKDCDDSYDLINKYVQTCNSEAEEVDCDFNSWSGGFVSYVLDQAGINLDGNYPSPNCDLNSVFSQIRDDLDDKTEDYSSCFTFSADQAELALAGDIACYCSSSDECDGDYDSGAAINGCDIVTELSSSYITYSKVIGGMYDDNEEMPYLASNSIVVEKDVDLMSDEYVAFIRCG